jgi:hypothetical protein
MADANEIRLARRFVKLIDTMGIFHPGMFAMGITTEHSLPIQQRVMDIFLHCISIWAGRYDSHFLDNETMNLYTTARRIQDTLDHYETGE